MRRLEPAGQGQLEAGAGQKEVLGVSESRSHPLELGRGHPTLSPVLLIFVYTPLLSAGLGTQKTQNLWNE